MTWADATYYLDWLMSKGEKSAKTHKSCIIMHATAIFKKVAVHQHQNDPCKISARCVEDLLGKGKESEI